jgi:hypothetical protein
LSRTSFVFALLALAVACGTPFGDDVASTDSALEAVPGRWTLPASIAAIGAGVHLGYDSAPRWSRKNCSGSLKTGTRILGEHLLELFPAIQQTGGYNCRPNTANTSKLSVHGTGRALDLHIPRVAGQANNVKGDAVANWCVEHASEVGIQLVIWDQTMWRADGSNDKKYGGPNPHTDHLHVELTEDAAAMKTSFFVNGPKPAGDAGVVEDAGTLPPPPDASPPPVEPEEPEEPPPPPPPPVTPDASALNPPVTAVQPTPPKSTDIEPDVDDEPGDKEPLSPRARNTRETAEELDTSSDSGGCSASGRSSTGSAAGVAFPTMLVMLVVSRTRRRARRG